MDNLQDNLVYQLKESNALAFEQLYEMYSAKLFNSICIILYNKELAKDIVQNSFLTIWEKREMLDPQKNFSAYLFTIARNLVFKETERLILHNKFINSKETIFEDNIVDKLDYAYVNDYIKHLIGELPEIPRKIFDLKRQQDLSNKEIALQLNLSERAVEAHSYRTLKLLKQKLRYFIMIFL